MKKYLFLTLIFSTFTLSSIAQSTEELNRKINELSVKIDAAIKSGNPDVYENLIPELNQSLINNLVILATKSPDFMQKSSLTTGKGGKNEFIFISNSKDQKFKIFSWSDGAGTIGSYQYVAFWKAGNKIKHKISTEGEPFLDPSDYIRDIYHSRRTNGNDLYFCITEAGDRNNYGMDIQCFEVDKSGNLKANIPVFKAGAKTLSSISIKNYNDYKYSNVSGQKTNVIHFSADGKTLYVPIISSNWTKSGDDGKASYVLHYFVYQFDGANFVYKKKE